MPTLRSQNESLETDEMWGLRMEAEREAELMTERRIHERRNVQWSARIVVPEGALACTVFDLSLGGARVRLLAQLQKYQRVRLDIDKVASLNADVVWLGIGMIGIRFTDDPAYIARSLGPLLTQKGSGS
jgi:PilZ domain